jgi:hypothetical protein
MKKMLFLTGVCCRFMLFSAVFAQPANGGDSDIAVQKAAGHFYSTFGNYVGLYNGTEHILGDPRIKGTPYFLASEMQPANIVYDGVVYTNVPLLYEVTTDRVAVRQYGEGVLMDLVSEKLSSFYVFGHLFVNLMADSSNKVVASGFYDQIYSGSFKIFAKREKRIYEDPNTFERSYVEKTEYYLFRNNTYYSVNDRGEFLAIFKDKKKDLTKYLRQTGIKFKKDPENAMVKMAEYYDKLTH